MIPHCQLIIARSSTWSSTSHSEHQRQLLSRSASSANMPRSRSYVKILNGHRLGAVLPSCRLSPVPVGGVFFFFCLIARSLLRFPPTTLPFRRRCLDPASVQRDTWVLPQCSVVGRPPRGERADALHYSKVWDTTSGQRIDICVGSQLPEEALRASFGRKTHVRDNAIAAMFRNTRFKRPLSADSTRENITPQL